MNDSIKFWQFSMGTMMNGPVHFSFPLKFQAKPDETGDN
jgi:hypothetical protein